MRDANSATIGSAQLALTEIATPRRMEAQTDESGEYIFTNLRPGLYKIEAKANDFSAYI